MIKKILLILVILFTCCPTVFSAITFDSNGRWETTFDCAEQTLPTFTCGEVLTYLDNTSSNGSHSTIGTAYNNPSGGGGCGYSQTNGYGNIMAQGDGVNDDSETIYFRFPSPQKEFWARYYVKFPTNWRASPFGWIKLFYIQTNGNVTQTLFEPDSTGYRFATQGGGGNGIYYSTVKLSDTLGGSYTGDDTWHCMEIHLKMDTDTTDGIGEIWIDGTRILRITNGNFSRGGAVAREGFTQAVPILNQSRIVNVNNSMARVSLDDAVIYNTPPPGRDIYNNPYIGPIGANISAITPTIINVESSQVEIQ